MGKDYIMTISILTPPGKEIEYKTLSDVAFHDLGLDNLIKDLSSKHTEREIIRRFMSQMTDDPAVTEYRCAVFDDMMQYPKMRQEMLELLEKVDFIKSYGTFKPSYEEKAGAWDLLHRLGEIGDYIKSVEAIYNCLNELDLVSEGLTNIRNYVKDLFDDKGFAEMKKDIEALRADTQSLKSVTLGVNLNDRFEAEEIGVVSINSKPFKNASIVANLSEKLSSKDHIKEDNEWNDNYRYSKAQRPDVSTLNALQSIAKLNIFYANPLLASTMGTIPEGDVATDAMQYMDKLATQMITHSVKRLRDVLKKYIEISLTDISGLIPEFIYYIRWAEYIEKLKNSGIKFTRPIIKSTQAKENITMKAKGIFNLKLLPLAQNNINEITTNDIDFDDDKCVYILTGANRGGKTTITQAVGQLFVLAQGGIAVPGECFEFAPVDGIYTHFPADEDKTLDLGRLGEECKRFRELYFDCSRSSLLLLNETFSTTSFEEGYYIAYDAVKAILAKGVRTIYNTHMHKLAYEIEEINSSAKSKTNSKAASLVVEAKEGERTYKVKLSPPEGNSYANDIANKYGVTYQQLIEKED